MTHVATYVTNLISGVVWSIFEFLSSPEKYLFSRSNDNRKSFLIFFILILLDFDIIEHYSTNVFVNKITYLIIFFIL